MKKKTLEDKTALSVLMFLSALQQPRQASGSELNWGKSTRSAQYLTHFRYYSSNIGRFLKPDNVTGSPLNPQNWNLYSYVRGNPVNFNDPTGHQENNSPSVAPPPITTGSSKESDILVAPQKEDETNKTLLTVYLIDRVGLTQEQLKAVAQTLAAPYQEAGVNITVKLAQQGPLNLGRNSKALIIANVAPKDMDSNGVGKTPYDPQTKAHSNASTVYVDRAKRAAQTENLNQSALHALGWAAAHEIGHTLQLYHSNLRSLMYESHAPGKYWTEKGVVDKEHALTKKDIAKILDYLNGGN